MLRFVAGGTKALDKAPLPPIKKATANDAR